MALATSLLISAGIEFGGRGKVADYLRKLQRDGKTVGQLFLSKCGDYPIFRPLCALINCFIKGLGTSLVTDLQC